MQEISRLVDLPISSIQYNHITGLFAFTPRKAVDLEHVAHLKSSIQTLGLMQPIIVQASSLQGIAGNHRFLAVRDIFQDSEIPTDQQRIQAVLIECSDDEARMIALVENELRQDLTKWEEFLSLQQAFRQAPKTTERIFGVDAEMAEQLRLWSEDLDYSQELGRRKQSLKSVILNGWVRIINSYLANFPELKAEFLSELRQPTWLRVKTTDELVEAINDAVFAVCHHFHEGESWNTTPTEKCLGPGRSFAELCQNIQSRALYGSACMPGCCPALRIRTATTAHFIPNPDGTAFYPVSRLQFDEIPEEAIEGNLIRGTEFRSTETFQAFCLSQESWARECYLALENEAAKVEIEHYRQNGMPAVQEQFLATRKARHEFVLISPTIRGIPCAPQNCPENLGVQDLPACVLCLSPNGRQKTICLREYCPTRADAPEDLVQAEQRSNERGVTERIIDQLADLAIGETLIHGVVDSKEILSGETLDEVLLTLVPLWDTKSMRLVLAAWERYQRKQIGASLGMDWNDKRVRKAYRDHYQEIAAAYENAAIGEAFERLRLEIESEAGGATRWLACLARVHQWRALLFDPAQVRAFAARQGLEVSEEDTTTSPTIT
jgi:hypothetical protein